MGKKKVRKRQNDPQNDSESSEDLDVMKCTHLAKGINLPALKKNIPSGVDVEECETCSRETTAREPKNPEPSTQETPVTEDDPPEDKKDVFVCLQCGHRGCGRKDNQHALQHHKTPRSDSHDLALSTSSWMTWCYKCDDWVSVDSARLGQAVELVRKQAGLSGKPKVQVPAQMKRSQSQVESINKVSLNKLTPAVSQLDLKLKEGPRSGKEALSDVLQSLPPVKGLVNLGNTCFFNSVMQVLSQTHWLTQLLDLECREGKVMHLKGCDAKVSSSGASCASSCSTLSSAELDASDSGVGSLDRDSPELLTAVEPIDVILGSSKPLTLTLASFVKEMHCPAVTPGKKKSQSNASVTPSSLFNQVTKKNAQFRGFQQQDAHELLRHLLDGVRTEEINRRRQAILQHFHIPASKAVGSSSSSQPEVDGVLRRKLKIYGRESTHTFVDQLFGGLLLSTVICESCHFPYQILEPFMDLSLPVSEEKSPPSSSHKRGKGVAVASCFSPPPTSPVVPSKHRLKKERILARKAKGKAAKSTRGPSPSSEDQPTTAADGAEETSPAGDADASILVSGSHPTDVQVEAESDENPKPVEREEEQAEEAEEEQDDLSESADVEDNEEANEEPNMDHVNCQMKELSLQAKELLLQQTVDPQGGDKVAEAATLRKVRSDWISRSLSSLAVRYQATNHECSVLSCLNSFTAPELLTGSNKYGCDNCTRRRIAAAAEAGEDEDAVKTVYSVASKQMLIFAPPALLTLHLKRFTQNGMTLKKVNRHVDFPPTFDLAPFCSASAAGIGTIDEDQKRIVYSLYGVIEHSGRLNGGHYTACVKVRPVDSDSLTRFLQQLTLQTSDLTRLRDQMTTLRRSSLVNGDSGPVMNGSSSADGVWYHVSDSHVMAVSEDRVMRSQAFLLFYERIL